MSLSDVKVEEERKDEPQHDDHPSPTDTRPLSHASTRSLTNRSASNASGRSLTTGRESSPSVTSANRLTPLQTEDLDGDPKEDVTSPGEPTPSAAAHNEEAKKEVKSAGTDKSFDEVQLEEKELEAKDAEDKRGREETAATSSGKSTPSQSRSSSTRPASSRTPKLSMSSTFGFASGWGSKKNSQDDKEKPPVPKPAATTPVPAPAPAPEEPKDRPPMHKRPSNAGSWGWFSRRKTHAAPNVSTSPVSMQRRDTSATITSIGSNPDSVLSKLDSSVPAKESLKERFKAVRAKEEAEEATSRPSSGTGLGIKTESIPEDDETENDAPARNSVAESTNSQQNDDKADSAKETVNWDLWQQLVYDGPSVVAKTSPVELTLAIANGIPNPIRGVVWQVLAQSKSEELEQVYRELSSISSDKAALSSRPASQGDPSSAASLRSAGTHKDSVASSSSSIHSETSTAITTNGMASPTMSQQGDKQFEARDGLPSIAEVLTGERRKKIHEDIPALKKLEKTIRKDLGARSNYAKYFAAKEMQEDLFGVCKAYALYDEGVGYAQGMNFIVMPLLFNMPAEEAFCLLVRLMNHYNLRRMFIQDMPGLHLHLHQFEKILEDVDPVLSHHLHKRGITPSLYATQWFLTLFAYKFPLQLVLRVYDLVLSEGLEGAILKFGIAVMKRNADTLKSMNDMSQLKTFLSEKLFDAYIDGAPSSSSILEQGFFGSSGGSEKDVYRCDLLVQDACDIQAITPEILATYAREYETKTKEEHDRQFEVDNLRTTAASQAAKLKGLETRVQTMDSDQAQMATELIRSKLENEELRNNNTELETTVGELRKQLDVQPAEVEAKLKDEMDRIMARNMEVQNQNRGLEEQMAEMEANLVEAKMKHAEIQAEHDALKLRWTEMRKMLGD